MAESVAAAAPCLHPEEHISTDPVLAITACTLCGYVLPSSSSTGLQILGRVLEDEEGEQGRIRLYEGGTGYVGRLGRGLDGGQGKGLVYHEKRRAESEQFMRKVLTYFTLGGLFQRTKTLFSEAKRIGKFKWGPTARMIAVACVYIAVRERDKPVTLEQLAGVNDLDYVTLTRAQFTVKYWLKIKTHEVDPIIFLERPIVHISELFSSSSPPLHGNSKKKTWSKQNLAYVRALNLAQVRSLATGLLTFAADLKLNTGRVAQGVAAAAVIVAMEGVSRKPTPLTAEFFDELGHLLGVKAYTVSERYREFINLLSDYAPRLPWLGDLKGGKGGKGVKKDLVQYTADIVQFRKSLEAQKAKKEAAAAKEEVKSESSSKAKGKRRAKKEESDDEDFGDDEEAEGVDWDDQEGEDDPPGGPSGFFVDPLIKPKAAAATLRVGDDAIADDGDSTSPPPPASATWSQLAASFHERKVGGTNSFKRPAEYMRHRPGPVKRVRTIEQVAQSLLSPFGAGTTSTPSPAPPSPADYPSPVTAGVSPAPVSPPPHVASPPAVPLTSIAPTVSLSHPEKAAPFASHSSEAFEYRQLLLEGHDPSSIFEGSAAYAPAAALRTGRLDRLLFIKPSEEISDSELFDEGELEGIIRSEEEVAQLRRTEKWSSMPEDKPYALTRPREQQKRRTRIRPMEGPTREELEQQEKAKKLAGLREEEHKELFRSQRRSKVSKETKERLARLFAAEGEDDGEGAELEEALNLGLGVEAAQSEDEQSSGDEG